MTKVDCHQSQKKTIGIGFIQGIHESYECPPECQIDDSNRIYQHLMLLKLQIKVLSLLYSHGSSST